MLKIKKFSLGIGDRFGREGLAQIWAIQAAQQAGFQIAPVWNKSHQEHNLIGSEPEDTRAAGETAARSAGFEGPIHFDADHIGLATVDRFLPHCDFYTIDVAESIGHPADSEGEDSVRHSLEPLIGRSFPELGMESALTRGSIRRSGNYSMSASRSPRKWVTATSRPWTPHGNLSNPA